MEILEAVALVLLTIVLFWLLNKRPDTAIPKVSLREYLPGGLFYPVLRDPQNYHDAMISIAHRYGRVFRIWLGPTPALATADPSDIVQIMTSEAFGHADNIGAVFRVAAPGGLTNMARAAHRAARRVLRDRLNPDIVRSFESSMTAAVAELCDVLTDAAHCSAIVDVSKTLSATTLRVITDVAFGSTLDKAQREAFGNDCRLFFELFMEELLGYPVRQWLTPLGVRKPFFAALDKVTQTCRILVRRRLAETPAERDARRPDILDAFMEMGVDERTATSLVVEFTVAGSHTSNQLLAWSLYETCGNPRVTQAIHEELRRVLGSKPLDEPLSFEELQQLTYVNNVWRETLRMHPIGTGFLRKALQDVKLQGSGATVRKGEIVLLMFSVLHEDEGIWNAPHEFRPERWGSSKVPGEGERVVAGGYLPFGVGIRSCAGRLLADYEGALILAELHRRFEFELACRPDEVLRRTALILTPRYASKGDGILDMGVPIRVRMREGP